MNWPDAYGRVNRCKDARIWGWGESWASSTTLSRKQAPELGKLLNLLAVGAEMIAMERWLMI